MKAVKQMPLESKITTTICRQLQFEENLGKLCFIRNNTGAIQRGKRFFRFGKPGSSDIILFLPNGKTLFLEIKGIRSAQLELQPVIKIQTTISQRNLDVRY